MQELWFLRSAHCLMLIDIHMKFREDSLNCFSSFRADTILWQTDTWGKNNMSPYPKVGRHNNNHISFL